MCLVGEILTLPAKRGTHFHRRRHPLFEGTPCRFQFHLGSQKIASSAPECPFSIVLLTHFGWHAMTQSRLNPIHQLSVFGWQEEGGKTPEAFSFIRCALKWDSPRISIVQPKVLSRLTFPRYSSPRTQSILRFARQSLTLAGQWPPVDAWVLIIHWCNSNTPAVGRQHNRNLPILFFCNKDNGIIPCHSSCAFQ